jgi:threonine dehydratase
MWAIAKSLFDQYGSSAHLITASSGGAGYSCAMAAQQLGMRSTIYIFEGGPREMIKMIEGTGAEVVVGGATYSVAKARAEEAAARDAKA